MFAIRHGAAFPTLDLLIQVVLKLESRSLISLQEAQMNGTSKGKVSLQCRKPHFFTFPLSASLLSLLPRIRNLTHI